MFSWFKRTWKDARAGELLAELVDSIRIMDSWGESGRDELRGALRRRYLQIIHPNQPLDCLEMQMIQIKDQCWKKARERLAANPPQAMAFALTAMYYESFILSGPDALTVRHLTTELFKTACRDILHPVPAQPPSLLYTRPSE